MIGWLNAASSVISASGQAAGAGAPGYDASTMSGSGGSNYGGGTGAFNVGRGSAGGGGGAAPVEDPTGAYPVAKALGGSASIPLLIGAAVLAAVIIKKA